MLRDYMFQTRKNGCIWIWAVHEQVLIEINFIIVSAAVAAYLAATIRGQVAMIVSSIEIRPRILVVARYVEDTL